jgi:hypothetical protein
MGIPTVTSLAGKMMVAFFGAIWQPSTLTQLNVRNFDPKLNPNCDVHAF